MRVCNLGGDRPRRSALAHESFAPVDSAGSGSHGLSHDGLTIAPERTATRTVFAGSGFLDDFLAATRRWRSPSLSFDPFIWLLGCQVSVDGEFPFLIGNCVLA